MSGAVEGLSLVSCESDYSFPFLSLFLGRTSKGQLRVCVKGNFLGKSALSNCCNFREKAGITQSKKTANFALFAPFSTVATQSDR